MNQKTFFKLSISLLLVFSILSFVYAAGPSSPGQGGGFLDSVGNGISSFFGGIKNVVTGGGPSSGGTSAVSNTPALNEQKLLRSNVQKTLDDFDSRWNSMWVQYKPGSSDALDKALTSYVESHQGAFTIAQLTEFRESTVDQVEGNNIYDILQSNLEVAKDDGGWFGGGSSVATDSSGADPNGLLGNVKFWTWPGKCYYGVVLGLFLFIFIFAWRLFLKKKLKDALPSFFGTLIATEAFWIAFAYNLLYIQQLAWLFAIVWLALVVYDLFKEKEVWHPSYLLVPATMIYSSSYVSSALDFSTAFKQVSIIAICVILAYVLDYTFVKLGLVKRASVEAREKGKKAGAEVGKAVAAAKGFNEGTGIN